MKTNIYSVEWQMQRYNISKQEAERKIESTKEKARESQRNMSAFDRKAMSSSNPEHWIKKGYSKAEAKEKGKEHIKKMQLAYQKKKKENPEKYKSSFSTNIEYWIKLGYSHKEAEEKIKERQATSSLENFQRRYGKEIGKEKWRARQVKWQETLDKKSPEEKERINKLKGITLENMIRKWGEVEGPEKYDIWLKSKHYFYSPVSQKLFFDILEFIKDKENVKFGEHNNEKYFSVGKKTYAIDFFYNGNVIEFNGDKFHANPKMYDKDDTPAPFSNLTAKDIWELDNIKNKEIKKKYKLLIIWEQTYKSSPEFVLEKCLTFLNL